MNAQRSGSTQRRTSPRGVATLSAITLALSGLSITSFNSVAPDATAATLSGGIRDKSGAVEQDAQQASDLPAGSCVVEGGEKSGSQAGFSWNTLEPGPTSPDKKAWGLSVAFDNSKDRTFTDWYFSNSENLNNVLDVGQVPSMEASQTFIDKNVTHKADESIDITASGRSLRNLNLYAELTDEKVKQFASASAGNPVRYAWQSNYKQDNPYGRNATQEGSAIFSATVNPWPSENIECNPISVSWESAEISEKHVIVPGEETKVGHINVPELSDGETDDSLSRMVVEAYDGNGKFIGTTDPEASGGEQLLRVDEKTGDIFFTWPEYRGTDQATDKNVNFSVLAKPRSVNQLQAATKHNNDGNGKTFDSSNSLDRYSKANVIDSKAFSLDDTEYHDPKYDKTDASIISGVDSATGPLATEPQKVKFNQVPDLIKDLAKKKGDGGFEAKVSLDEKYVYEGWTVEMDEDYNVTVTAPENPKPGTFARPVVTVEYSNGSTDELELLVVVDPNNTQVTDLVRPSLTKGTIGDELNAQVGTKSIMKGHKPVHPAKFEVDPSTVPEGWTVTVDETGKVTAKADDTVAPGTIITPKVKATYPDQTTDEIETQFQAIVDIKVPDYDTVTNKPTAKVALKPAIPERGLSGNTTDEAPKRYTFKDGKTEYTHTDDSGTWTVKIDENTGEITTTIPRNAPEGYILDVPVLAYYDNVDKPQQVKGTVVVLKSDISPTYSVESTGPNQAVNHNVQDAPKGSKFSFGNDENGAPITEQEVDGWKYTVDPDTGVVSSTPPADAKPGDKKTVNVTVTTPDGSTPLVPVTTVVNLANNWEAEPSYPVETVYPGETAKLPVTLEKPENVNVAKDSPYKLGTIPDGWTATIDDNGQITATAPADAEPGSQVEIPVTVTYEDGSTDTAKAVVNVVDVPKREVPFDVVYKYDDTIPAGTYQVETEGKPGAEKQNKDGSWEQTKAPTNEVVIVGTKPAESAKDVTWTVPIPYPTEVRENPDLKPGETKVVQEGANGEKTYTAKFTAKGDNAEVVEEETTKEPVKRIVEYGPELAPSELVTKTEKPIPFTTKVVFDDTLKAGEQVVDQKGEVGTEVETSTQKLVDGKPSGEPTVTTERTKEPTNAVIRVGTKTEGTNTTESEVEVPFETEIQFDDSLPAGTQETVQEGKPGKDKVTTTQTIENSKVTGTTTETERVEEPVKKIIKVGTKGDTTSKTVEWTESTPFEVEVRENPDLKAGETKLVREGKPGEVKHIVTVTSDNGEISTKDATEEIRKPTKQIIEVGTAPSQTELSDKHTEQLPFETLIESDPNLEAGKIVEDQAGSFGEKEVTKVWKLKDGKVVGDPETTEDVTKEPTPRKLRVGTKVVTETQTETETEKVTETKEVPVELDRGFYGVELTKPAEPASQNIKDGSEGNTYEIGELPAGWTATVDENGTVTATPPADAKSGDYAEIPVTVTPEGGKPYTATATFIVKDDQPVDPTQPTETEVITAPTYNPAVIEAGDTQTVDINYGHTDGNTYELGEVPAGWTVTIDETTGQLMVTPPADTPSGTIQEIPVTVTTEDGQTFNVKTVIGVISDNCGCEPVEPTEPTDETDPADEPTGEPTEDRTDPTEDPKDPTGEPTTDPTDEPTGKPTVDPSEGPSEDPTEDPKDPTDKPTTDPTEDPTDEPTPGKPDEPQDPEPGEPNNPKDPEGPSGSSIPDGLVPIIGGLIGGGILGSSVNDHQTPGGSPDAKPKVPTAPQPKPGEDEPKISGKVELNEQGQQTNGQTNQSNPSYGDAPRNNSTTSSQSGSKSTSGSTSSNRALADTGANVLGIVGVGIALIIGSTLLLRRERRND